MHARGTVPHKAPGDVRAGVAGRQRFRDRRDAGRRLANLLAGYAAEAPVVLALPRGGVPVAYEIARKLNAELEVLVSRKVGVPWHRELGIGAVAEGGHVHVSPDVLATAGLGEEQLAAAIDAERDEVAVRVRRFRGDRPRVPLGGRTVILVDDGIATGGTVMAALAAIHAAGPRKVVLAVPVAPRDTLDALASEVDEVVCPLVPVDLHAIGLWYEDFEQVEDAEVVRLLEASRRTEGPT